MSNRHLTRIGAAAVAISALTAELLFLASHWKSTGSLLYSVWLLLAYLTDWSNLLVALVCTATVIGPDRLSSAWWRLAATVAILVVGIMFAVIGGWSAIGKQQASSLLAHVATPALMTLWWLGLAPHGDLKWRDALRTMLFPVAYLVAMFGRGVAGGGYPYPEVDVARVGWAGAVAFSGGVALVFLAAATMLVVCDRLLHGRTRRIRE